MKEAKVFSIGTVVKEEDESALLIVDAQYAEGLKGLDEYGYVQVIWWADKNDTEEGRENMIEYAPYSKGPDEIGVFATRSPERPNPICISNAYVCWADEKSGTIKLAYIDADDGTPVLDIKPYIPSVDRVEHPIVPKWCAHWPKCVEESGDFDWESEFNF